MTVQYGSALSVDVRDTAAASGAAAGVAAADAIRRALNDQGRARVIFASAPSQEAMLGTLVEQPDLDWSRVEGFHMDEYLGLPTEHPQAFGPWLVERLAGVDLGRFERIRSDGEAEAEVERYSALLREAPIDAVCMGIGVNGHIAFNEPNQSTFDDQRLVRTIELDLASRQQQVDDDCFPALDDVPTQALTLTIPALLSAREIICTVPGEHKSSAVERALEGPIDESCPASVLRTHSSVQMHLDSAAASRLDGATV